MEIHGIMNKKEITDKLKNIDLDLKECLKIKEKLNRSKDKEVILKLRKKQDE